MKSGTTVTDAKCTEKIATCSSFDGSLISKCPKDKCSEDLSTGKCTRRTCSSFATEIMNCPTTYCLQDLAANTCTVKPPTCESFKDTTLSRCPAAYCSIDQRANICTPRTCSSFETQIDLCPTLFCVKDMTTRSCTPKPKECGTFSGAQIANCPTDRCVADAGASICNDKPRTCPDFDGALLQHCPQDKCNLDLATRTCRAKAPACSTYETRLDFCPKDRCAVDFIQRTCLPKTCGSESVTLKDKDAGPYVTDKTGRRHVKYILPLNTGNGAVNWDLSVINFTYDYYPFYQVSPAEGQCQISSFALLNDDGTLLKSRMVGTGNNGLSLTMNTTAVATYRFLLQATTKGGVRSPKVAVTMGVCRENSLSASSQVISRVIDRYSTNVFNTAAGAEMPNVHRVDFYKWRDLFKNGCGSCQPRFQIVSSDKVQFNAPIWFDAEHNLLIKTTEGLRVKGYIKVFFADKHCERISEPVYVPFKFEICGQERVSVVEPTTSLSQKFMMGIDKDVELSFEDLRKEFKTDSDHCKIQRFQVVTRFDGVYYDLSPNLASRFYNSPTGIRLINYLGAEQDLTVYIKAFSTGKAFAYKPLKVSYKQNSAPSIGGDISQNLVEVKEDDDNTGKT